MLDTYALAQTLTGTGFAPVQVDAFVNVFRLTYTDPIARGDLDRTLWVQTGVILGAISLQLASMLNLEQ